MAPEVEGSIPFTHPIFNKIVEIKKAPVAQMDRVADFESVGRTFKSYRARQIIGSLVNFKKNRVGP